MPRTLRLALLALVVAGPALAQSTFVPEAPDSTHLAFRRQILDRNQARLEDFLAAAVDTLTTTAEAVLARHLAATGGRSAWERVRTLRVTLLIGETGGAQRRLVRTYRRSSWFRQEMLGGSSATVTDGRRVWRVSGSEWTPIPDNGVSHLASLDDWMLDPGSGGVALEHLGVVMLNHVPVHRLRRTFADGQDEDLFFGVDSGRLAERCGDYPSGPSFFSYWDYREAGGGILLPMVMIRSVGDFAPPHGVVVEEVEFNPDLPDSVFAAPPE